MSNKTDLTEKLKKRSFYAKIQAYIGLASIIAIGIYLIFNIGEIDLSNNDDENDNQLLRKLNEVKDLYNANVLSTIKPTFSLEGGDTLISIGTLSGELLDIYLNQIDDTLVLKTISRYDYEFEESDLPFSFVQLVHNYNKFLDDEFNSEFNRYITDLSNTSKSSFTTIQGISNLIIRIGTVLIAFYLIQILLMFTRYQFRYSDFLSGLAFALEYSDDTEIDFDTLASKIDSSRISLGKNPKTATEEVVDLLNSVKGMSNSKDSGSK